MKNIVVNLRGEIQEGQYPSVLDMFLNIDRICVEDDNEPVLYYAVISMDKTVPAYELNNYITELSVFGNIKKNGRTEITGALNGFIEIKEKCRLMVDITENKGDFDLPETFFVNKLFDSQEERMEYIKNTFIPKTGVGEMVLYELENIHFEQNKLSYSTLKVSYVKD